MSAWVDSSPWRKRAYRAGSSGLDPITKPSSLEGGPTAPVVPTIGIGPVVPGPAQPHSPGTPASLPLSKDPWQLQFGAALAVDSSAFAVSGGFGAGGLGFGGFGAGGLGFGGYGYPSMGSG